MIRKQISVSSEKLFFLICRFKRAIAIMGSVFCLLMLLFATGFLDWRIQEILCVLTNNKTYVEHSQNKATASPKLEYYFSKNYQIARSRFILAGEVAGARMHQIVLNQRGPENEELIIDIAWLGSMTPKNAIVHVSGVHGVEGFAGSAIQIKILENQPKPPKDGAIMFVHILNPYGMAWLRRYNESNVDLNRNFRFEQNEWSEDSLAYAKLDSFLNPRRYRVFDSFFVQASSNILRYGVGAMRKTIPAGQNFNPKGLFYFGNHLEDGPRLYHRWVNESLSSAERLIVIDVHTGLGRLGQESLLHKIASTDSPIFSRNLKRQLLTEYGSAGVIAYTFRGGHSEVYSQLSGHCKVDFITQEFGTYPNVYVLQALRDENRAHHFGSKPQQEQAKQRLQEAFNPGLSGWQSRVIRSGESLFVTLAESIFNHENG